METCIISEDEKSNGHRIFLLPRHFALRFDGIDVNINADRCQRDNGRLHVAQMIQTLPNENL